MPWIMSEKTGTYSQQIITQTLVFHSLSDRISFGINNYSPSSFIKLLQRLSENGVTFVSPDTLTGPSVQREVAGSIPVVISFDDGYRDLIDVLPHVMEQIPFKPLVFVPTFYINKTNSWDYTHMLRSTEHLTEHDIERLASLGVVFGSHGHRHINLTSLDYDQLHEELSLSRDILQELTGQRVSSVSYPFGRYNDLVTRIVDQSGYKTGFTMCFPQLEDTSLLIGRIPVYTTDSPATVWQKLTHGRFYSYERTKTKIISMLSGGTMLYQRLRGLNQ